MGVDRISSLCQRSSTPPVYLVLQSAPQVVKVGEECTFEFLLVNESAHSIYPQLLPPVSAPSYSWISVTPKVLVPLGDNIVLTVQDELDLLPPGGSALFDAVCMPHQHGIVMLGGLKILEKPLDDGPASGIPGTPVITPPTPTPTPGNANTSTAIPSMAITPSSHHNSKKNDDNSKVLLFDNIQEVFVERE